ncbi:relaxase/mobilization nuclease domain-containing protein [Planktothrix sp. FACHB-1355]|uniref:Relaxase/mobilization nuclease domain-containing protein n=1 Tax=Aerosakkonema funiforme FACHB-1375 TaxID=2949571 RepID=A0A926VMI1_9CYAN|nr:MULTISPECIES: relaxase/mobilization nuclease domain-containing protein [Oscillatoriales]MBD2186433.1 relaxase/mobilization nuclease domain-containing protein [Aerosakkonema funiforme FACHB-1375]MBD3561852.1 relaxase/mobilization nuclease domain-containing protein [Planktothrix sp. FACHB-1355]
MIGKQIKGKGFRGCLDYVLGKKGAYIIGGTMCGQTAEALSTEFAITRQLKPHLKIAVFHATLSVDAKEKLDSDAENDRRWCSIADDYMKAIGFDNNQYVVAKHTDTEHDHIHIIGSRIRFDGTVVDDSWDYYKSQEVIRSLEAKYSLETIAPSWESEKRAQTTAEYRKNRDSGQKSVRVQLQSLIDECVASRSTMPELIERLQSEGVEIKIRMTRTGCIKGISYQLNDIAFNGTQLGKAYTFYGLQKYRGISYDSEDNELLKMLTQQQEAIADSHELQRDKSLPETNTHTDTISVDLITSDTFDTDDSNLSKANPSMRSLSLPRQPNPYKPTEQTSEAKVEQSSQTDTIIAIALDALITVSSDRQTLGQYNILWNQPQLTLSIRAIDRGEILKAAFAPDGTYQLNACQITELDIKNFQAFGKQQQQRQIQLELD